MDKATATRRTVLKAGMASGLAGVATLSVPAHAAAQSARAVPAAAAVVVPWLDQPDPIPAPAQGILGHPLIWETLDSWRTSNAEFFTVKHYNQPVIDKSTWRLAVDGLVDHPSSLSLEDLRRRPRKSVDFTLECSGNNGLPFLIGGIGNARWTGTPLAAILRAARPRAGGVEVIFWGTDRGSVTIRDNSGVTGPGRTGSVTPDSTGGLDLTITERFSRGMSLNDALNHDILLCYQMNGVDLPPDHGAPLRLIIPGSYGVANVKWLSRIEVRDGRAAGRFNARDYVTIREGVELGETVWTFTNVFHGRLKSAPARVLRRGPLYQIHGAAWGGSIGRVEVRIDDGPWHRAALQRQRAHGTCASSWTFWSWDWHQPTHGERRVTSRVFDDRGKLQPPPTDPYLASRRTYWENNGQITRKVLIS